MYFHTLLTLIYLLAVTEAIWPQPVDFAANASTILCISPNMKTTYNILPSDNATTEVNTTLVQSALSRFQNTLYQSTYYPWKFFRPGYNFDVSCANSSNVTFISEVTIQQLNSSSASTEIDESYNLTISTDGEVVIGAATTNGAMYGLTTLTQLFSKNSDGSIYTRWAPLSLVDKPYYSWRGLNIDIARNYHSPSEIMHLIDGMAFNKFNRLHIHATDSQSWPIDIPSMPQLAIKGAYQSSYIWSAADLESVQNYAFERGIQTVIEIDSPGHTASIHWSNSSLIAAYNQQPWMPYAGEPPSGQVMLNSDATHSFFSTLYNDLLPRVKPYTDWFHIGGDEINENVYLLDPTVNSSEPSIIEPYLQTFVDNLMSSIVSAKLKTVVWEDIILTWKLGLDNSNIIVQSCSNQSNLVQVVSQGYQALFGPSSHWYLDCGYGQWLDPNTSNPETPILPPYVDYCSPMKSWREIYSYDPTENVNNQSLLLGGEVHIWGELTDSVNLDSKVWPRACAAAEVLWSGPQGVKGVNGTVTTRLADMRERMVAMGFQASMVTMTWCLQNPGNCTE